MTKMRSQSRPGPFIRLFAEEGARVLGSTCRPERCLNATRVCLDVMRAFSVTAQPISVQVIAMNREYVARLGQLGCVPTREELDEWIKAGAWAIGIDTSGAADSVGWNGHLVALVQKEWIVDAAALQFNRPERGIRIEDVFIGYAPRWFLKGKDSIWFERDGARLGYRARPEDQSWKALPGFERHVDNLHLAAEITRNIAKRMNRKTVWS